MDIKARARAALDAMGPPGQEPIENLARRAMSNLNMNGGGPPG
jgi:hypothetical protein